MAIVTANIVDWTGAPQPGLSPRMVFQPRSPASQGTNVFFSNPIIATPNSLGAITVALIDSFSTTPAGVYDVSIQWLDTAGNFTRVDYLTGPLNPLIVPAAGGTLGSMLLVPTTALMVWVGETNNTAYGFWYQPSTAILRSNP